MPDNAAEPASLAIPLLDSLQDIADGEILLVPRDLLVACVEHGEVESQIKQPFWAAQGIERAVLGSDLAGLLFQFVEPVPHVLVAVAEKLVVLLWRERTIHDRGERLIYLFPPDGPEI